ncbi:uncharacterized protein LOC135164785 [Diachasmimorpha longicaudata]|uniref:uncharacterized protein LOC135164785 n=1 Tax=Diachasmimorpha longicaudata TaxID=58733 RepID=UPI0030B8C428
MAYKVFCIILLVCIAVQAAPKFEHVFKKLPNFHELVENVGIALKEAHNEGKEAKKDGLQAAANAVKAFSGHVRQSAETKKDKIKKPMGFAKGVFDIIINQDKSDGQPEIDSPPEPEKDSDVESVTAAVPPQNHLSPPPLSKKSTQNAEIRVHSAEIAHRDELLRIDFLWHIRNDLACAKSLFYALSAHYFVPTKGKDHKARGHHSLWPTANLRMRKHEKQSQPINKLITIMTGYRPLKNYILMTT